MSKSERKVNNQIRTSLELKTIIFMMIFFTIDMSKTSFCIKTTNNFNNTLM